MTSAQLQGEVYDLGYQRYSGPREGRSRARKALYFDGVKLVLGIGRGSRAKILPFLLFASAMTPAVVFVIILSSMNLLGVGDAASRFIPGPADYYGVTGMLFILFGAIMAPELLTLDRKNRVIDLYFVRPITSNDYVVARVAAFLSIVFALAMSGQVVLQIGLLLTSSDAWAYLKDNWLDIPRFIGAGALLALFVTAIPMAAASFFARRAYATAFVIGLFLISTLVVNILTAADESQVSVTAPNGQTRVTEVSEPLTGESARYLSLLSLRDLSTRMNDIVFGQSEKSPNDGSSTVWEMQKLPTALPVIVYLLYVVIPLGLIWRKYRRMRL
jgi:ABC-2 type transport system permease protein